jgi:Ca-activated chloride channel family protein
MRWDFVCKGWLRLPIPPMIWSGSSVADGIRYGPERHLKLVKMTMLLKVNETMASWLVLGALLVVTSHGAPVASAQTTAPSQTAPNQQPPPGSAPSGAPSNTQAPAPQPQAPAADDSQQPVPMDQAGPPPDAGAAGDDSAGMFVFKKEVQEVMLHATVLDAQRNLVPNLDKNAFTIFENGTAQPITSFRRQDVPVAMGIVVDNSGSMRDKRDEVNRAVLNLIRASNPQDEIFVVNFSQNYYLDQDYTSDVNLLQAALHQVSSTGSTALYDAVVASAVHLRNNHRLDKKVLLVVTDGEDNMSQETLAEAMEQLQQKDGPTIYAIGLLGSGMQQRGKNALQKLAKDTGGVAYFPDSLNQVSDITRTVAHDIRTQYMIAYRPRNQNAKPDNGAVRVEAQAPGYGKLNVLTRSAYAYGGQTGQANGGQTAPR